MKPRPSSPAPYPAAASAPASVPAAASSPAAASAPAAAASGGSVPARRRARGPIDPRLLRHARAARTGVGLLALIGAGQAGTALMLAAGLTAVVAGSRSTGLVLLVLTYPLRALLAWAEQVVAQRTAARATDELRRTTLAATLRHGPAWIARYGSGRLIAALTTGLDALRPWFAGYLPATILGVALPPLVVIVMAVVDPMSAIMTVLTLPLVPVLGALIGWATEARSRQRWAEDARLAGHFLDVVRGLATLRVFGRAERQTSVVAAMTAQHRTATMRVLRVAFLSSTALDLLGTLAVGLIAVGAGLRVAAGDLPLAPALLVILLAPEAFRPLREAAARYHASAAASAVIDDIDEVLDAPAPSTAAAPAPSDTAAPAPSDTAAPAQSDAAAAPDLATTVVDRLDLDAAPGVRAKDLTVRHPDAGHDALRLQRLEVHPGEIVALRGFSGAGKTTALRVLAGLQPFATGSAELFGPDAVYLPQHPVLPHARTVADVAGIGALRAVGLERELPLGTALGEHGAGVSAGQRQRLALAAALSQAGETPRVLLLDEPTAHLDAVSERRVIAKLRAAADRGCAVLVVAHRPALLAAADRTVVVINPPAHASPAPSEPAPSKPAPPKPAPSKPAPSKPAPSKPAPPAAAQPFAAVPARSGEAPADSGGQPKSWLVAAAAALGCGSWLAGIVLTGAAAWLLVRAATLPPVLSLSAAVVLVRGSAVARPLLRYAERLAAHQVAFAKLGARRAAVYAGLIPRVPGPRVRRRGELLTRVVDDVDADVDGLLRGWLPALAAVGAVLAGAAMVAAVRPAAALPVAAGLLVAAVAAPALGVWLETRRETGTGEAREALRDAIVETVDGVEELSSLGVPEERSRQLATLEARAAREAGIAAALGHVGWGLAVIGAALALLPGGALGREWAAVLVLGVVALAEPVAALPDAALAHRRAVSARRRLSTVTSPCGQPPELVVPARYVPTHPVPGVGVAADARVARSKAGAAADPGAAYPGAEDAGAKPATGGVDVAVTDLAAGWTGHTLSGLTLRLPPGSRTAILGPSGAGKSTLAAVLARFLPPRSGRLTLDGTAMAEIAEADFRRTVALVGDETEHVFASTVRENLRLARPTATDAELRDVLRRTGLELELDRRLGTGGSTISGGQRKRLATARALLAGPGLLILDEPTEGLDGDSAEALMADLLGATDGRTVLVLTHRTDGLVLADRVLQLDEIQVGGGCRAGVQEALTGGAAQRA
ncbi:thiol reductant ABC exporter subunit CydC [Actinoplanes sp. NPDC049265]|uniref:thiol reductant ABC exporter subunit CydC n=1 Tax=Actinoplanes sp. NPDC049265 TaxID=3363902 RepID=UPI003723D5A1